MELYVSTDVEADGPIPGPHSMLSFGSAAFVFRLDEGRPVQYESAGTFTRNLDTLPGAAGHATTMTWWQKNKAAWDATRTSPADPETAMREYVAWIRELEAKCRSRAVFVAYPATYDFLFVYWYLMRFVGESPFSHSGLDIKTYAMALLPSEYRSVSKRTLPRRWFGARRHTHVALDDAIEQGELFCRMVIERHRWAEPATSREG